MNLLAIECSTERLSIALHVDDDWYVEERDQQNQHAQYILPLIEGLLSKAHVTLKDLQGIVFGRGPGSFTGLRIACSVAKGLAYAHNLPVYPVSGLWSIAETMYHLEQEIPQDTTVLALLDARMHQLYWGYFPENKPNQEYVTDASHLVLPHTSKIYLAGVGFEAYEQAFPSAIQSALVKKSVLYPNAGAMIRLVQKGKVQAVSAEEALPIYVRDEVVSNINKPR